MKIISTLILSLFCWLQLSAQCAYAGSPQSLVFNLCAGQSFDVSTLGDEVLAQFGDSLVFVVHDGGPTTLGNIIDANSAVTASDPPATGHFEWSNSYQPGVTYQITAFAGSTIGIGPFGIDLSDPCLSVSPVGTVVYNQGPPVICAFNPITLTCQQPTAVVTDVANCVGNPSNYTFAWTGPNGFNSNEPSPTVSLPGTYCVVVTTAGSSCSASYCVSVQGDANLPTADAGPDMTLNCTTTSLILNGSGSSGAGLTYQWTTTIGNIVSNTNTLNPVVDSPGEYCLIVTDLTTGCSATDCVVVVADIDLPIADAGPQVDLDCNSDTIMLGGPNTSTGSNFTYLWSSSFLTTTTPTPFLTISDGSGQYCLTVTNNDNGCTASDCVFVSGLANPYFNVFPAAMRCDGENPQLLVDDVLSQGNSTWQYSWSTLDGNIVSGQDSIQLVVDQPGSYCVTVTNTANGCANSLCVNVYEKTKILVESEKQVCLGQFASIVFGLVPGSFPMYRYVQEGDNPPLVITTMNDLFYTYDKVFEEPTTLKIWAEKPFDPTCMSDTAYVNIIPYQYDVNFDLTQDGCQPGTLTVSSDQSYTYQWGNGILGAYNTMPINGWNYVTIIAYPNACVAAESVFVTLDFLDECATIDGIIQIDSLDNCSPNPDNPNLPNFLVQAIGLDTFYATTDSAGHYLMPVDPGSYTVSVVPSSVFWEPCGNDFVVNLPDADSTETVDFLVKKLPGCPEMTVDIVTPFLRRCFPNTYFVNYCNQGVEPATDAYVTVQLDDFLTFNSASIANTDLGNNLYRFDLGNLDPGDCGSFNINATVSCDAVLGQAHCTEAHIYPDSSCIANDSLWSGASLRVAAVCDGDSLRFTITNEGTAPAAPLDFVVIEDAVMYLENPPGPILGVAETFELAVPANGSTWRMEVQQEPYHPVAALPIVAVEGCGANFSTGFINQFPLGDNPAFLDIDCTENIGSFDPNDKQGFPVGYGNEHQILPGTELQYLIRFQNTGTDTAFLVVIRDTLSSLLDMTTVRPGASSHPYQFEVYGQGVLRFTFDDILLPDSSTNQAGSNGFVHFTVTPRADVPLSSVIENTAAIYFDFNEPVLTNTVFHTIDTNFIIVNGVHNFDPKIGIAVLPNPFASSFQMRLTGIPMGKPLTFHLMDAVGREVWQEQFVAPEYSFKGQALPAGLYFFKVTTDGQVLATGKLVRA